MKYFTWLLIHLPVILTFEILIASAATHIITNKLTWNDKLATQYSLLMMHRAEVGFLTDSINELNTNFTDTIFSVATELEMYNSTDYANPDESKPWFDSECRSSKKDSQKKLKKINKNGPSTSLRSNFLIAKKPLS